MPTIRIDKETNEELKAAKVILENTTKQRWPYKRVILESVKFYMGNNLTERLMKELGDE